MSQCSCKNCDLEVFENSDKCIFHCEKSTWITKVDPKDNDWDFGTEVAYYWDDKKVKKFWKKFKRLIKDKKDLSEKESYYRFDGFIFPRMSQDTFKDYIIDCDLVFTKSCNFEDNVEFFNTTFNGKVYFNKCKIRGNVSFVKSIFNDRFTFNDMKEINEIYLRFARFEKKVEFKESECNEIDLENTTFKDLADFYQSKFQIANFTKTDFEKVSVFSECEFNCDVDFKYTKFLGKAIFMDTVITGKLDLRNAIFEDDAYFLDITSKKRDKKEGQFIGEPTEVKVANRETARVIKSFYDYFNNIIEANKFYALEMKEREKELEEDKKNGKNLFEWLVFKIHGLASNHSQDWLLSLFWIFSFTFSFVIQHYVNCYLLTNTLEYILVDIFIFLSFLYGSYLIIEHEKINKFWYVGIFYVIYGFFIKDWSLSVFSNQLNPFSIMTGKEHLTFGGLIYKVIIAYLIYQLIISIRQNTRRK